MTDFTDETRLRALWQDGGAALAPVPLDEIKRRAKGFGDAIRRRNRREYGAAAIVVAIFALYTIVLPELLLKLGSLLVIAGAFIVMWQLSRRTSRTDPDAEAQDVRGYYRARLVREAHMLARIGRWYLAPFVPGLLVFLAGLAKATDLRSPVSFVLLVAFQLSVFGGIWWLNRRAAAMLRAQIDRIDRACSPQGDLT
ncbi:hypothetical protein BWQ93_06265 [Sphingopyxis sp. QXT-31]|uniref:hypothetical protein n=1 Tax=Sphingopyxis sp. QXT-31 TaxID=1357916 RepID=UPI0009794850|nr:hypothetical protein [Sphingopyxis sp. QXT-31]APZ98124.1 hypothetical protein BWQ93_06265 [Sphingopyxis sp. QXT-31]